MSKPYPAVGDIWKNPGRGIHYLLLEETSDINFDFLILVLETGKHDRASAMHFLDFCTKVS